MSIRSARSRRPEGGAPGSAGGARGGGGGRRSPTTGIRCHDAEIMRRALEYCCDVRQAGDPARPGPVADQGRGDERRVRRHHARAARDARGSPRRSWSSATSGSPSTRGDSTTWLTSARPAAVAAGAGRQRRRELRVTCEVTPHHFTLTDEAVRGYDTNTKMNPPLRTREDIEAIKEGLRDGTIDAIATDHAPHSFDEKEVEYPAAPFGIVGLETAIGLAVTELLPQERPLAPAAHREALRQSRGRILRPAAGRDRGRGDGEPDDLRSRGRVGGFPGTVPVPVAEHPLRGDAPERTTGGDHQQRCGLLALSHVPGIHGKVGGPQAPPVLPPSCGSAGRRSDNRPAVPTRRRRSSPPSARG